MKLHLKINAQKELFTPLRIGGEMSLALKREKRQLEIILENIG